MKGIYRYRKKSKSVTQPELADQLSRVSIFEALNEEEREELSKFLVPRTYEAGQIIFLQGLAGQELYLVVSGAIAICRETAEGRQITLAIRESGCVVGELSLLDGQERSASGYAQGETSCLVLSSSDFWRFLDNHTALSQRLMVSLARRLRESAQQLEDLAVKTVRQRLASLLMRLALDDPAETDGNSVLLQSDIDYKMLSGMLYTNRESVSRAATELVRIGLVAKEKRRFRVLDLEGLSLIALEG